MTTASELDAIREEIKTFLANRGTAIERVAKYGTEIFEARCFVVFARYYENKGYTIEPVQDIDGYFEFKYSTRAYPWNHSYIRVIDDDKGRVHCEIRHNQSVAGRWNYPDHHPSRVEPHTSQYQADIAVVHPDILPSSKPSSNRRIKACIPNYRLITLAEVKKMEPTPMLVASFQGIVYAIKPQFLSGGGLSAKASSFFSWSQHPYPVLCKSSNFLGQKHTKDKGDFSAATGRYVARNVGSNCVSPIGSVV